MVRWRVLPLQAGKYISEVLSVLAQREDKYSREELLQFQDGQLPHLTFTSVLPVGVVKYDKAKRALYSVLQDVAPRVHEAALARQVGAICLAEKPPMEDVEVRREIKRMEYTYTKESTRNPNVACRLPSMERAVGNALYAVERYKPKLSGREEELYLHMGWFYLTRRV